MPREAPVTSAVLPVRSFMSISLPALVGGLMDWSGCVAGRHGHGFVGSCPLGARATEQEQRGDQAQDGEPDRRGECGLVALGQRERRRACWPAAARTALVRATATVDRIATPSAGADVKG